VKRALVIGGGLAGLTAAFRLRDRYTVTLLERGQRLGGQIHTELDRGFVIERGAEGFVARSQALPALARDLGMPEGELIGQAVLRSYGFDGQQLLALQPGEAATLLGFQVPPEELGKGIASLRRGMGSLISALTGSLHERVTLALGSEVGALELRSGELLAHAAGGATFAADCAIVAIPAAPAAELLATLAGDAARALSQAEALSSVTVELGYAREQIGHALDASGYVVAQSAQQGVRACTFTSSKFVDRAPHGSVSLRLFFRPSAQELATLDDDAWTERAVHELARALPVRGQPRDVWVSRWSNALPVFSDAHRSAVAALEQALAPYPLQLAGSAFHGSGIDAAVRSAERAAAALGRD